MTQQLALSHQHQRFELRPPGSFPLCAAVALQSQATRDLQSIIDRTRQATAGYPVVGLILTGSVARGEGALMCDPEVGSRWLSDLEFHIVLDDAGTIRGSGIEAALGRLAQDINTQSDNRLRGIKVGFNSLGSARLGRLRPSIFNREMLEHGKLVWGDPSRVPVPRWWLKGEKEVPLLDAFRLLNNRIVQQIDARVKSQRGGHDAMLAAYTHSKFWIEIATSLSVFCGCYRTTYRERQRGLEEYLTAYPGALRDGGALLVSRLRRAISVKLGEQAPEPCDAAAFQESARLAALVWWLEARRMLGVADQYADGGPRRSIIRMLRRLEPPAQRVRDWVRLLRRCGSDPDFKTDLKSAIRAGSLANAIYASACLLHFFWEDTNRETGAGPELLATVRDLLNARRASGSGCHRLLAIATVAAWERHLKFAPR